MKAAGINPPKHPVRTAMTLDAYSFLLNRRRSAALVSTIQPTPAAHSTTTAAHAVADRQSRARARC
jgi:hypothetical protein